MGKFGIKKSSRRKANKQVTADNVLKEESSDTDIKTLDALIAAGLNKVQLPASDNNNKTTEKKSSYKNSIQTEKLKPVEHRSIFSPSTEYLKKQAKVEDGEELEI